MILKINLKLEAHCIVGQKYEILDMNVLFDSNQKAIDECNHITSKSS
jgi:hypothetical protein